MKKTFVNILSAMTLAPAAALTVYAEETKMGTALKAKADREKP